MNSAISHKGQRCPSRRSPWPRLHARPHTFLLGAALLCTAWPLAPAVRAQTSTPIYGSDTITVAYSSPVPRLGGESHTNSAGEVLLGSNAAAPSGGDPNYSYGFLYDPQLVDVSQGFVSRGLVTFGDSNGVALVVKNPATTADFTSDQFIGAFGLPSSLSVTVARLTAVNGQYLNNRGSTAFRVFVSAVTAGGVNQTLGTTDLTLSNFGEVIQVRYLAKFHTVDVYFGSKLALRVPNVDLKGRGIVQVDNSQPDSEVDQAVLGWTSADPRVLNNGNNGVGFDPAMLEFWSVGNNLVFGVGLGPNFYEDRFPFLTQRQSVWNSPDTVKFQKSLEAKGTWDKKVKDPVGIDGIFSLQPGAFARNYDVGLSLEMDATGGTADISYPVFLDMSLPTQYSADPGQSFIVPISFYSDPAATIATTSPGANVTSDLIFGGEFGFSLNTILFGSSLSSGDVLDVNIPRKDIKIFDLNEILGSGLIPNVNGGINYAGYFQGTEGATGTKNAAEHGTKGTGSTEGAKKGTSLASFVQVNITYPPDLSTSGYVPLGVSKATNLTSSADSPLVTLLSDFTNDILGEIPGLDILPQIPFFNNDYGLNLGGYPAELGFHIADLYGSVNLGAHVDYNFTPKPQVWLLLSDPNDAAKNVTLGPFAFDPATSMVTNPPTVNLPANGDPLTITPVLTLSAGVAPNVVGIKTSTGNTFKTNGQLTIGGSLSFNPFEFSYKFGDSSFNSSKALGLPFPYTLAGSVPVVTHPLDPFEIGNQNGGTANAVPFQRTIKGKSFTLFPKASGNPVIDAVSPASVLIQPAGAGGSLPITLTCEHAYLSGQVIWDYNGDPNAPQPAVLSYNRQNASLVTSAIPNSLLSALGLHTITLINQDGTGASYPSNAVSFAVTAPAPRLDGIKTQTPAGQTYKVIAGGSGFTLLVSGENFLPPHTGADGALDYVGSVVQWNGQPLPTVYQDRGNLTAIVPSNLVQTTATAQITVDTAGPGGGQSAAIALTPINPVPVLSSLSQSGSQPGSTGLTLDLNGSAFTPNARVLWNDGTSTVTKVPTYQAPSHLTLALDATDLSTPGVRTLQVQNPSPGGGLSAVQTFTIGQYPAGGGIILVPSLTRSAGGVQLQLTVVNTSQTVDATDTLVLSAKAQGAGGITVYPLLPDPAQAILIGTIPAAQSVTPSQVYVFPASLGARGQAVALTISGSSSGKAFNSRLRVILP